MVKSGPAETPKAGTSVMAAILGISVQHLIRMAKEGTLPAQLERGSWDIIETVHAYIAHVKSSSAKERGSLKSEELQLLIARKRKTTEDGDAQALKNQQMRREVLMVSDVERTWIGILSMVRSRMLAVTSRIRQRLPHLTAFDADAIDREIRDALTEAANDNAA